MTAREVAAKLTADRETQECIVRMVEAAELIGEEREGLLCIVESYASHLRRLGYPPLNAAHLVNAVEAAVGTVLEARGEVF